jgi:hypothetical protein
MASRDLYGLCNLGVVSEFGRWRLDWRGRRLRGDEVMASMASERVSGGRGRRRDDGGKIWICRRTVVWALRMGRSAGRACVIDGTRARERRRQNRVCTPTL